MFHVERFTDPTMETPDTSATPEQTSGFKPFLPGNPGGPPGPKTKLTVAKRRELALQAGITPLQFLMSVVVDDDEDMKSRIDAAKAAAPYFHRRMPIGIESTQGAGSIAIDPAVLAQLSDDELDACMQVCNRLHMLASARATAAQVIEAAAAPAAARLGAPDA